MPNHTPPAAHSPRSGGGRTGGLPFLNGQGQQRPPGTKPPPHPHLPRYLLRTLVGVLLLLVLLRPLVLPWAQATLATLPAATVPPLQQTKPTGGTALTTGMTRLARVIVTLYRPPLDPLLHGAVALALLVVVGELGLAAGTLVVRTTRLARDPHTYLRMRTPRAGMVATQALTSGSSILTALHQGLPEGAIRQGAALSFTITGHPDAPATLGVLVRGGTTPQRAGWVAALRKIVIGHCAGAVVDERADPLTAACTPGAVLVWQEFALHAPPSYPLRLAADATHDGLGPLLAALRPRPGTTLTEVQVCVRPRQEWHLAAYGWRVQAMRRFLKLQARQLHGLRPDAIALQSKIESPTWDTTVRLIAVAPDSQRLSAAQAELAELAAMLGQYAARNGNRVQTLVPVGAGQVCVPAAATPTPVPPIPAAASSAPGGTGAVVRPPAALPAPPPRRVLALPGPLSLALPLPVPPSRPMTRRERAALAAATPTRPARPWAAHWPQLRRQGQRWWQTTGRSIARPVTDGLLVMLATALGLLLAALLVAPLQTLTQWSPLPRVIPLPAPMLAWGPTVLMVLIALLAGHLVLWLRLRRRGTLARARLARLLSRPLRLTPPARLLLPFPCWRGPAILSGAELGGLWHLPDAAVAHLVTWLPCQVLPAPAHAFTQGAPDRLMVALAAHGDGTLAPVGPTLRDLRQVFHATAGMGAGKSRLLANLCQQLFTAREDGEHPTALLVGDGKGDDDAGCLVAILRTLLPREAEERLILLDVLDTEWPIGINPLQEVDLTRPGGADLALGQILAIFGRLDPDTWGKAMGMQQFIRMAALLVLEGEATPTLAHIKQALIDPGYREQLLPHCTNVDVTTFWRVIFPKTGESQKMSLDALLRRFDNLLSTETTRYLLTQPRSTVDLRAAMENGMIVLMPLPEMTLGGMAGLIGMLLVQSVVRAAFARVGSDQTRRTVALVLDELQVFVGTGDTTDIQAAITRLRSLGIAGIYLHQSLTQLHEVRDEMLINAQNRVVFQTQEPDASVYGRQYPASQLTAADIAGQDPMEHQYLSLRCGGTPTGLFSAIPLPWPTPVAADVPLDDGPHWQTILPPQAEAADGVLAELIYAFDTTYDARTRAAIIQDCVQMPAEAWAYVQDRWAMLGAVQRAYILQHPGCIPDRLERQRWLSRLLVATPRLLAAVNYARTRPAVDVAAQERDDPTPARKKKVRPSNWGGSPPSHTTPPTPGPDGGSVPDGEPPDRNHRTTINFGADGGAVAAPGPLPSSVDGGAPPPPIAPAAPPPAAPAHPSAGPPEPSPQPDAPEPPRWDEER